MPSLTLKAKSFHLALIIALFFSCSIVQAQLTQVEQLRKELREPVRDSTRLRLLMQLSKAYSAVDPIKKFEIAVQGKELAEKLGNDTVVADAYLDMGISYGIRSKPDSAIYYFNKGYLQAKKHNYLNGMARSLSNIGFAHDRLDDKQTAIKCYLEALPIFKKLNFYKGINQTYINIGSIYNDMRQHKVAEGYFMRALKSYEKHNDEPGIANAQYTLGNVNMFLKQYDKAQYYMTKSLASREKAGDLNGIAKGRMAMGRLFIEMDRFEEAIPQLKIAFENTEALQDTYLGSAVLSSLCKAYLGVNNTDEANRIGLKALEYARSTQSLISIADALEVLIEVEKKKKNIQKAFDYQDELIAVTDSIQIEKVVKDVTLTEFNRIRLENDGLQRNYEKKSEQNTYYFAFLIISSVAIVLLAVLLILSYRRNKEKKHINEILRQQKEEIVDANNELEKLNKVKNKFFSIVSHDLRAPLANLKMLLGLYRDGDIDESELRDLISRLEETIYSTSNFLDNLLEWSKSQLDGIVIRPKQIVLKDLTSENIRLMTPQITSKQLSVNDSVDAAVTIFADSNMINVVIRNILTNCIKFCRPGDVITMEASTEGDRTTFVIRDNGPGIAEKDLKTLFSLEHTMTSGSQGETGHRIGLVLCREMLHQNNGTIVVDSELGEGSTFIIELPAIPPFPGK
jgi:two-component system sensor histidine kinase/response regulator